MEAPPGTQREGSGERVGGSGGGGEGQCWRYRSNGEGQPLSTLATAFSKLQRA